MRFLFVKTSAIGDLIQVFPALDYLKQIHPQAEVDWVVESSFASLIRSHPHVSRVIEVDTKSWRKNFFSSSTRQQIKAVAHNLRKEQYEAVFDFQGNLKSGLVTALTRSAKKIGFSSKCVPEWPNILFTNTRYTIPLGKNRREDYLFLVQSYLETFEPLKESCVVLKVNEAEKAQIERLSSLLPNNKQKVMVCPGSNWLNKQLSFETLVDYLKQQTSFYVLVWGTEEEYQLSQKLHALFPQSSIILEKLSLPALQHMMGKVDLVFAMDSLPLHLAGTTSTPSFGVFGPSSAHKYKPLGQQHQTFQGICPYGRTFEKRCPILRTCPTGACMKNITAKQLKM